LWGRNIILAKIPLSESDLHKLVPEAHRFLEAVAQAKGRVYVHCSAGVSIVLSYLMKTKEWSLLEAYQHVKAIRPGIQSNVGFLKQLLNYEQELFGTTSEREDFLILIWIHR
jgi:protein-tyrosine phosphatase